MQTSENQSSPQDLQQFFLNTLTSLTCLEKAIFKYLHWFCRKFRNVYPSVKTIAEALNCSTKTVCRSTSKFERFKWIIKIKRGYRTNLYYMDDYIKKIELDDTENLIIQKRKCLDNVPILKEDSICNDNSREGSSFKENISKAVPVPKCINIHEIPPEDRQRLAKNFSEFVLIKAIEYAGYLIFQKKQKIDSLTGFLWAYCKKRKKVFI